MTQEEKKLLLKDLCGRLPYGVIVNTPKGDGHLCSINQTIFGNEYGVNIKATERDFFNDDECDIKPYLRPMSDMTEEEKDELRGWGDYEIIYWLDEEEVCFGDLTVKYETLVNLMDWLYKHHFDIHCLIEKGLAMQAQKGMYNIK